MEQVQIYEGGTAARTCLLAIVYGVVFGVFVAGLTFWLLNHPAAWPQVDPASPEAIAAEAAGQYRPFRRAETDEEYREFQLDIRTRNRIRFNWTLGIGVGLWVVLLAATWRIHQSKRLCLWFTLVTPVAVVLAVVLSFAVFWSMSLGGFGAGK